MKTLPSDEYGSASFPENLVQSLRSALAMTDRVALYNVTHDKDGNSILDSGGNPVKGKYPRGGPFGAALAISFPDGTLELIGEARGNNVVNSGIASQHAEDRALQPDNYAKLLNRLDELQAEGRKPMVWMISSGQSCPNCHTKQEIMARDLIDGGYVPPRQVKILYGATFDDTLQIAQFYDAQYADAMILASSKPKHAGNLVQHSHVEFGSIAPEVQDVFRQATIPTAVIVRDGKIHAVGTEARTDFDLYSTAEVNAVREACLKNRRAGEFASWAGGGELFTTSDQPGPLILAEVYWTGIRKITSVNMPPDLASKQFKTYETSVTNTDFLNIVGGGYQHPGAAIEVYRDESYKNTAQPMWARVLKANNEVLYNGAAVSDAVLGMRDESTRFRFAAAGLCSHGEAHRPIKPLKSLGELTPSVVD